METSGIATSTASVHDILVVGAGVVGLAFACAVKQAAPRVEIALVDPRPDEGDGGLRTVALAAGSRALLARIGVWDRLEPLAQPILKMTIFDGGESDPVRLEQLGFEAREGETLAHMAFADDVVGALRDAARGLGVETIRGAVAGFTPGPWVAELDLADGRAARARLVVAADGARSRLRTLAGIGVAGWETGQAGIVATIGHARDHEGRAEQHFLPAGPFAILPLRGRRSSIVWNESLADAKALLALDPEDFVGELERRFTLKLGAIHLESRVESFPLSFRFARRYVGPRLALIGDAAHLVHPLAGQGLNLGLRDVAALAEAVVKPLRLGLDPGDAGTLAGYARARRFDAISSGMGMDAMNRLFSNDIAPLRYVRDLGLRLVDRAPAVKRRLIAEAGGAGDRAPRLLRGWGL
jgi:2-octaprenyl-6-methoxyphenol hydroxylase